MNQVNKPSPFPYSLTNKRNRRAFRGWLHGITRVDDLLQPGTLIWWSCSTEAQKRHVRDHVRQHLGDQAWQRFREHLKLQRRESRAKRLLRDYVRDEEFVMSVNRELSDHSQVLQFLPASVLADGILLLRHVGVEPERVARAVGVSVEEVNQIATPEALEDFGKKVQERRDVVLGYIEGRCIAELLTAQSDGLSVRENLAVLRWLQSRQPQMPGNEPATDPLAEEEEARREREVAERHRRLLEAAKRDGIKASQRDSESSQ